MATDHVMVTLVNAQSDLHLPFFFSLVFHGEANFAEAN